MKLLICTQKVDSADPVLGFFHRWLEEFAKHVESVEVICLYEGGSDLPANVKIHSLGKEKGGGRLLYIWRFYKYAWSLRRDYDTVLVHMNPEYVLLGGAFWKMSGKKVGLWYMHKSTGIILRTAEKLVEVIFSATKESFRLPSSKLILTGHGIDTQAFCHQETDKKFDLITVGRITRSKNLEFLLEVLDSLLSQGLDINLAIVGEPQTKEEILYKKELVKIIEDKKIAKRVFFLGSIPNQALPATLSAAKIFVHAATNGSLDKAVLEALLVGLPVVSSAEGVGSIPLQQWKVENQSDFIAVVKELLASGDANDHGANLKKHVEQNHSLQKLIPKIVENFS